MKTLKILILLSVPALLMPFCKKKDDVPATCDISYTYESHVKNIISSNCSGSSCHSSGASNQALTTYAELKPYIDNGKFKNEVVDKQSMPKGSSLGKSDLNAIKCWVENGYPEK